jgi:hypothetical protein
MGPIALPLIFLFQLQAFLSVTPVSSLLSSLKYRSFLRTRILSNSTLSNRTLCYDGDVQIFAVCVAKACSIRWCSFQELIVMFPCTPLIQCEGHWKTPLSVLYILFFKLSFPSHDMLTLVVHDTVLFICKQHFKVLKAITYSF